MADVKIIKVNSLDKVESLFKEEKAYFEKAMDNFKSSSLNKSSNINIISKTTKLNLLYDNLSGKYNKASNWLSEYLNEVKGLEKDLISGIEKIIEESQMSKIDMNIPSPISISTIITNLGLIMTTTKGGISFYSGVKDGIHYTLHLPESEVTSQSALVVSFNGGGESGSKPGDFSKIHNSLGCKIISEQPKEIKDKVVVLAIQLFQNESLSQEAIDNTANIIKEVQLETGISKERTGSLSHSIGGRFSAVLVSKHPELMGFAAIVSPSKDRVGQDKVNFYDFDKVKETLTNTDTDVKIIWGSGDGNKKDNGQSVSGVSNRILKELDAESKPPTEQHLKMYGEKINVYSSEKVEFIEIIGKGHGIGQDVAESSFDYFINDYLGKEPKLV